MTIRSLGGTVIGLLTLMLASGCSAPESMESVGSMTPTEAETAPPPVSGSVTMIEPECEQNETCTFDDVERIVEPSEGAGDYEPQSNIASIDDRGDCTHMEAGCDDDEGGHEREAIVRTCNEADQPCEEQSAPDGGGVEPEVDPNSPSAASQDGLVTEQDAAGLSGDSSNDDHEDDYAHEQLAHRCFTTLDTCLELAQNPEDEEVCLRNQDRCLAEASIHDPCDDELVDCLESMTERPEHCYEIFGECYDNRDEVEEQ